MTTKIYDKREDRFMKPRGYVRWLMKLASQANETRSIRCLFLLLLMITEVTGAWGQTDYSGTYYIGSTGYNAGTPNKNYYLCPSEGWCYYQATNDFTSTDNGQPFLTTYKCRNGSYDVNTKAVWIVEKHPTQDYYYIKRVSDGKYIVLSGQIRTTSDANRMRVHLESLVTPDDKALFSFIPNGTALNIKPKTLETYLTVNGGNTDAFTGQSGKGGGPTGYTNTKGIIGIYPSLDDNAKFYLEKATIDPPVITNNFTETNTITITAEEGATIYYTTDGTIPTTSTPTSGTTPINITIAITSDIQVIRAIAKGESDYFPTAVRTYNLPVLDRPVITVVNNEVTITAADGASIYYTTDDTEATPSATLYSESFDMGSSTAIRAIATKPGYYRSAEAVSKPPLTVHSSSEITEMNRSYILASDFSLTSSVGTKSEPFRGTIDGQLLTLSNLSYPLVAYSDGAIIKNVILDNVSVGGNTDGNAGAICAEATGATRIYNCGILSGSVGGSGDVGGIVGKLDGTSRVINCYSYANITGGNNVGGIVGCNYGTTTAANVTTMIMNCMFYGDITGGTNISPVYGGNIIDNVAGGLNTYNYYAYDELKSRTITEGKYNCALAVEEKYLTRFELYRLLLNSNKKLAAIYATGSADNAGEMAKWVLETADRRIATPKPYPILKAQGKYPSIINYDAEYAPDSTTVGRNHGGKLGLKTLSVTIGGKGANAPSGASITNSSLTLVRTDKDFDRFNYNYDKVQLPYYDEVGEGNYTEGKVVTGWKITAIDAVTDDPYSSGNYDYSKKYSSNKSYFDAPNYNFADRKSSNKDLYSVSHRIFSQGAYFDVPYGVNSITIEPYWGNAAFVADEYYDVVYQLTNDNKDYSKQKVTQLGTQVGASATFNGQTIHKTISSALGTLSGSTVYDNAVVLVGNLHQDGVPSNGNKPFTLMSVDLDKDHEPDYSLIYHHNNRKAVSPIRFDFLNVPGTAQAQKPNGVNLLLNFTIFLMKGWFETTNTSLMYSNQVEYENSQDNTTKTEAPLILLGGVFDQFVSTRATTVPGKTIYIHVGSNVCINSFGVGTHSDGNKSTPHVPVSVTGGAFDGFYLTGTYNPNAAETTDNAECYISGGYFKEAAGACQEPINGNVRWQIYNADIDNFFGGGINDAKPIKGTITTDIYNSHVGIFCGGPKFGNMTATKDVTTTAEGCTFDEYFGAGYGGLSYSRQKYYDESGYNFSTRTNPYISERGKYYDGATTDANSSKPDYGKKGPGVATDYDYEFFVWSSGVTGARVYVKFASFSLAQCDNVKSTLTGCTINRNFYGGGSLGKVTGKATSVLDGCTVHGNVFGGGFSASLPSIEVRDGDYSKVPKFNSNSGMFEPGVFSTTTTFTWMNATKAGVTLSNNKSGSDLGNHYIYTDVDLDALGQVGETDLTITGSTFVEGKVFDKNGTVLEITGGVFGGGDESAVKADAGATGNTKVTIHKNDDKSPTINNVFGGGNTADVDGNSVVSMSDGTISHDVYGGGKGSSTIVGGNVTVNIGKVFKEDESVAYTGSPTITDNVYGGSALGAVNVTSTKDASGNITAYTPSDGKTTHVNIYAGTIGAGEGGGSGSVYGGGLGQTTPSNIVAQNFGNTTITMEGGTVKTAVYGGANVNGILKKDATVTITGGTVGTVPDEGEPITNVVFGGGYGEPTLVEGNITVNIGASSLATAGATINGHVYGGGALGSVNASKPESALVFDGSKKTSVNLYKGIINGNVYGGGLGKKAVVEPATPGIEAYVGGDVAVKLDGATLTYSGATPESGQIFGGNNLNGTPKGHVLVHVKRTVPVEGQTYDVAAVYGGGNEADYNPTAADYSEVVIEGCDVTSIKDVYGGGNAAAVPATEVWILGTKIIENLFGGGNGELGADYAAHVGFHRLADLSKSDYTNGTGKTYVNLVGGTITNVFGGSNSNGDIRGGSNIRMPQQSEYSGTAILNSPENCTLHTTNIYGGGKNADMSGGTSIVLGCMPDQWIDEIYAGAQNADVAGNVSLTITSGKFYRVFGGNKDGGLLKGSITVNVEETGGCNVPIVIGELYGGGNLAGYSIYGYDDSENPRTKAAYTTWYGTLSEGDKNKPENKPYDNPQLNIRAFTSIGSVFGGGYQAQMIADPTVSINVVKGSHASAARVEETIEDVPIKKKNVSTGVIEDATITLHLPAHEADKIGAIEHVFGGGNLAEVDGSTTVNIGTETTVGFVTEPIHFRTDPGTPLTKNEGTGLYDLTVEGATITGNVYGGGQDAVVTGDTQVNICAKEGEGDTYDKVTANSANVRIAGAVFGAGKGLATDVANTIVVMGGGSVGLSVYGGGELGCVEGNTKVSIMDGEIGDSENEHGGATIGNVYGGGQGELDEARSGLIKGNTTIEISGGSIYHNIYGGGAYGSVGTYVYYGSTSAYADALAAAGSDAGAVAMVEAQKDNIVDYTSDGLATITITGGTIGINGKENGMVFGSSRGDVEKPGADGVDRNDRMAWVANTSVTIGTGGKGTDAPEPQIKGSVYGSGENGHTYQNTNVVIHSGTIGLYEGTADDATRGNIYGGGCGTDQYDEDGNGTVDTYNPLSGFVRGTTTVLIDGGQVTHNVYGAGAMGSVLGSTDVTIGGSAIIGVDGNENGFVYAAAKGDETLAEAHQAYVGGTALSIEGGEVKGSAFGGGQAGIVKGAVVVSLSGGTVDNDVYGGGALAKVNTEYDATEHPAYTTDVTLSGTSVNGDLYGGGLGNNTVAADVCGPVTVAVSSAGKARNVFGCNNVNGAPKSTVTVNVSGGAIAQNVYGGGNQAAYLYADPDNPQNLQVNISGGTMDNVYGGGLSAEVAGGIDVNVSGGTITNDVYGGGALANTNTANWNSEKAVTMYDEVSFLVVGTSVVTGYFTRSGEGIGGDPYIYTEVTVADTKAAENTTYYRKITGGWVDDTNTSTTYKTNVTLTGGIMGNAYGGGLGNVETPVYVYGDVTVKLNEGVSSPTEGAAFTRETATNIIVGGKNYPTIPITGSIFGCNNVNGTPRGDVLVEVFSTRQLNGAGTAVISGHSPNGDNEYYEVQAVYGGGNQADYQPVAGKGTQVIIRGCDETSIEKVYGGGNSAAVPETDVTIWGTFDISDAFGGGNGSLPIKRGGVWIDNVGSKVYGDTKVVCKGGKIGNVFGGSDAKGNVYGTMHTDVEHPEGGCALKITKIYGASKEADVDGDVNVIINGCASDEIEYVCGGSYNANIRGDITLTITSGIFKNVYGGNDARGSIGGNIIVNIQEEDDCKPIIIQNLVGGGFAADYPGEDSKVGGNAKRIKRDVDGKYIEHEYVDFTTGKITVNVKSATRIDNIYGGGFKADVNGDTEVNINMRKGLWAGAQAPAGYSNLPNVHVKEYAKVLGLATGASLADKSYYEKDGETYTATSDETVVSGKTYYAKVDTYVIDDAIGSIGNVYGGGNEGNVYGDVTVNIGSEVEIPVMYRGGDGKFVTSTDINGVQVIAYQNSPVLGVNITSDVFGGGNKADVTGNTTVNVCAKKNNLGVYESVAEGASGVSVGGSIYGGGNKADVLKNTHVKMSGGYVFNGIFGGGFSGSVGTFTRDKSVTDYGHVADHAGCIGKPMSCEENTGKCTVVVDGGQIGPVTVATEGMTRAEAKGGPVPEGWVWGGSRGMVEGPEDNPDTHFTAYVNETNVTIGGTAFVMEGIIGGGEFGRVLGNTKVTIQDHCQIGVGENQTETVDGVLKPKRYTDGSGGIHGAVNQFINPLTTTVTDGNALAACSHWAYESPYLPYDPYYDKYQDSRFYPASTANPSDGKTWIGVVFGGGSGYYPYEKKDKSDYDWNPSAGLVEGNTEVNITGGHILTNVYGANEYTDVKGKSTVKMSGGTIGVPRTLDKIAALPMIGYLFGGGKGDQRTHFDKMTNVGSVEVEVSGGIIYGSVFGGAEDGHVLGDVLVNIKPGAVIGTWGTSYVDGNVFGGGRGYAGNSYLSGNVGGNVTMNITGGTMLGSVYGGGRLGSVGYDFKGFGEDGYGEMLEGSTHGHTFITIQGEDADHPVVIGNNYEFQYLTSSVDTDGKTAEQIAAARKTELAGYHIPNTGIEYDAGRGYYMLTHTKGGNVYAGAMGRREKLGSSTESIDYPGIDWRKLGCVKSTKLTIGDYVWIKGAVFGGGEFGQVAGTHTTTVGSKTVGTEIIINGGTIGTIMGEGIPASLDYEDSGEEGSGENRYSFGSIYGGGYGTEAEVKARPAVGTTPEVPADPYTTDINKFGALVTSNTDVKMTGGTVHASVYGGGKIACVGGNTNVDISGGKIGVNALRTSGYVLFGSSRMGNVYGGGRGSENAVYAGLVAGNSNVNISGGSIYHNVYGGGAISSVGTYELHTAETIPPYLVEFAPLGSPKACTSGGTATVTITGGTIGINGWDNGMVNGSGRGDVTLPVAQTNGHRFDPYDRLAWVNNTVVTIGTPESETGPAIKGSVYGGGENGHNFGNSVVNIESGTIGTDASASYDNSNVYGAGCGTDKYDSNGDGIADKHNRTAGYVQGSSTVNIRGGLVKKSVYGGGSMASLSEVATLNVSGGQVDGNVFGGPKGDENDLVLKAHAKNTIVNIETGADVRGNVFGGGEFGIVEGNVEVNMNGGTIAGNLYGGGSMADTNTSNVDPEGTGYKDDADGNADPDDDNDKKPIPSTATNTTTVKLNGGFIMGDAYGGALGRIDKAAVGSLGDPGYEPAVTAIEPKVYGDILVELNNNNNGETAIGTKTGCSVTKVFGSNDLNGTPKGHVKVHVYATQHFNRTDKAQIKDKYAKYHDFASYSITNYAGLVSLATELKVDISTDEATLDDGSASDDDKKAALKNIQDALQRKEMENFATALGVDVTEYQAVLNNGSATAKEKSTALENMRNAVSHKKYDVDAVYGGGDLAPYMPYNENDRTEVIIDGCELTSIRQVYGGSNAASTPATYLRVNGTYEIDEVFGGGNGKDNYQKSDGMWYENPGANVGYKNFTHYDIVTPTGSGSSAEPYEAIDDALTVDARETYRYGTGVATTEIAGGRIHYAYGGSNEKGNIRSVALSKYQDSGSCPLYVDETYGAGKNAEIDGVVNITLDCVDKTGTIFGGSKESDVNSSIVLNITNGTFDAVYGGNNTSGAINGSITVNIEEKGCRPIVIGELYGCGYLAPYSVYGYEKDGSGNYVTETIDEVDQRKVLTSGTKLYNDPHVNIISATSIGKIYGGGYKAKVVGSPYINVNMEEGQISITKREKEDGDDSPYIYTEDDKQYVYKDANGTIYNLAELVPVAGNASRFTKTLVLGTIGSIYGGGNQAEVDGSTHVDIGTNKGYNDDGSANDNLGRSAAMITGSVYGGGDRADVTGNTFVTMGNGYVYDRIYGGGNMGSVGTVTSTEEHSDDKAHADCIGKPTAFKTGTGKCSVTVCGGRVGPFSVSAGVATPKAMTMPDDYGYVFGASRGEQVDPATDPDIDFRTYVNETEVTIKNIYADGHEGDASHIVSSPLICGGVYGGSENGRVLNDTYVYIKGGQIGEGKDKSGVYDETLWAAAESAVKSYNPTAIAAAAAAMPECPHWPYGKDTNRDGKPDEFYPYDSHATDETPDARPEGSDGHTFYGNVFGGGSGYWPYLKAGTLDKYEWLQSAGLVEGNTNVIISGGHILTNVYGGNETTDVSGTCNVTMTGGTIGVPRILSQIDEHPVTCYLFGAGKGDQRTYFNKRTDVSHTAVNVSGGIIYGSVFGGGEDGHVLGDADVSISGDAWIGTWGTSYVDGNIFGGGRGFSGNALTAGVVCGCVNMDISGGTMLGSIYGGGRLGSVGTYLASPTIPNPDEEDTEHPIIDNPHYGQMIPDGSDEVVENIHTASPLVDRNHGHIVVNISGGTIGNKYEFVDPSLTGSAWTAAIANAPKTSYDTNHRLLQTKGGNVFAGCMGRRTDLVGGRIGNWKKLGEAKSTKLTISGDAWIMGNVYGGGEFGAVLGNHVTKNTENEDIPVGTEILIHGGTIGTEITNTAPVKGTIPAPNYGADDEAASIVQYTYGSVYGGGYGTEDELSSNPVDAALAEIDPEDLGAYVKDSTYINMTAGHVRASIFGGGEVAAVGGSSHVNISGGKIGRNEVYGFKSDNPGYVRFGSSTMGNVYGGGKGSNRNPLVGVVQTNTNINITPGVVEGEPFIYHNVYGGGSLASVGKFLPNTTIPYVPKGVPYGWTDGGYVVTDKHGIACITITGGTIGISGRDNGMVNGSSRGDVAVPEKVDPDDVSCPLKDPYDRFAWVNKSYVTIGKTGEAGPKIKGSVYGGGENGHNNNNAKVDVYSGTIGVVEGEDWFDFGNDEVNAKAQITRGNVYGAGCGTDTYTGTDGKEHNNPWSGCVCGDTYVNIHGGLVTQNVYGGGSMGSVGVLTNSLTLDSYMHTDANTSFAHSWPYVFLYKDLSLGSNGITHVNVTGGRIGTTGSSNGDVYGGARGKAGTVSEDVVHPGSVMRTNVNINFTHPDKSVIKMVEERVSVDETEYQLSIDLKDGSGNLINAIAGSVYGGGEDGMVYENTNVTLTNGLVGHSLYGGGKGKGMYEGKVLEKNPGTGDEEEVTKKIYSIIAGKVYGNTNLTMKGGQVLRNIFGGGNLGSVGKGNYAVGTDDYYYNPSDPEFIGYGEIVNENLWTSAYTPNPEDPNASGKDNAYYFLSSGIANVTIENGKVGFMPEADTEVVQLGSSSSMEYSTTDSETRRKLIAACVKDDMPTGNVFGGCRGLAAAEIMTLKDLTPRKNPEFFLGYVNESNVTIGTSGAGPSIYGSVYGGGQDGHVRRSTNVTMNNGSIGIPYNDDYRSRMGTLGLGLSDELDNLQWMHRGNVYGAGSGIGMYEAADGSKHRSSSAGSVTHCTFVDVKGGTVYRNVYGGGSLASVCPPSYSGTGLYPDDTHGGKGYMSLNSVTISGTIGAPTGYTEVYGGEVYGAGRGLKALPAEYYAVSFWTRVHIKNGANIKGNVFGGGDSGAVLKDAEVFVGDKKVTP